MKPSHTKIKGRILAVDDDLEILKLIELILSSAGYEVVCTASPITALEFIESLPFDCIITDAIMPHMNGYELVQAMRRHSITEKTPIIMLTRKRAPVDVKQALAAGANDYIVKPIDETVLKQKVNESLGKKPERERLLEISIHGALTESELTFDGRILKLNEKGFLLLTSVEPTEDTPFTIKSALFEQIGIHIPHLKIIKSQRKNDLYETNIQFVGLTESDSKKIRNWIRQETLKRET